MMAKMKSLRDSDSQPHFSALSPSPLPHQPPSARAYLPLTTWRHRSKLVAQPSPIQASMRPSRLRLVSVMTATAATPSSAAKPKNRADTPAAKSMPATMARSTRPVPRSLPASCRPSSRTAAGPSGMTACQNCPRRSFLRSRIAAPKTTIAILANSDGCSWTPATWIQLRLPWNSWPSPGTKISACRARDSRIPGQASRFHTRTGRREAMTHRTRPMPAKSSWRRNRS